MKHRVLIVEDESKVADFLRSGLEESGFSVVTTETGLSGEQLGASESWDVILLDVMLPDVDGFTVLRRWRTQGIDTKVLLLTARDQVRDKVTALNEGADDYMTKPFDFQELLARIHALLRRGRTVQSDIMRIADLEVDRVRQAVSRGGKSLTLTRREFELLDFFMRHVDEVVSRTKIAQHVWNYGYDADTNVIDVYVNYLRRKIDEPGTDSHILTVRGRGYMLSSHRDQ
jgi:DNA-binding response OmpR family regulator